jgi:hypothetical protein
MKPKELLSEYLNSRLSSADLRTRLASDNSRDAQATLKMLEVEDTCRNALSKLQPADEGAEQLVDMVLTADNWVRVPDQKQEGMRGWFAGLVPAMDVGGRMKPEKTAKKSAKPKTGKKKTQPRKKSSPKPKKKKR